MQISMDGDITPVKILRRRIARIKLLRIKAAGYVQMTV